MGEFTHFDEQGRSRMVDVGAKPATARMARASAQVLMRETTLQSIRSRELSKGDVLEVARLAGIMAAKRTDQLIPLCHSLPLTAVEISFEFPNPTTLAISAEARTVSQTGVEMEALTAATVAALTVYDMCKAVDREMVLTQIQLDEKHGGKSGHFVRG